LIALSTQIQHFKQTHIYTRLIEMLLHASDHRLQLTLVYSIKIGLEINKKGRGAGG